MKRLSAIFWDNDGVLMETEHLYFKANTDALARCGVELTLELFQEISLRQGGSVLELAAKSMDDERALRKWRDERYRELLDNAQVMPGVAETLDRLHGHLPMAIVTSCRKHNFLHMHNRSGLLGYFDFILTREDYTNSKPNPEPYLTACNRAGLPADQCIAIEDSERGVTSAASAGLTVVAMPGQLNSSGNFALARWQITSVMEILEIVGLKE